MRTNRGFTLLELLMVTIVIGVLAGIAFPRFVLASRSKSMDAAARSDLRNAMTEQEAYFVDSQTYAADLSSLNLTTSPGVTVGGGGTAGGYLMTAKHAGSANMFTIEVGGGTSPNVIR